MMRKSNTKTDPRKAAEKHRIRLMAGGVAAASLLVLVVLLAGAGAFMSPEVAVAQETEQLVWEAQLTVGEPEVTDIGTNTGWHRGSKYAGDDLSQDYIDVDGKHFEINSIRTITNRDPSYFVLTLNDITYAQATKIRGATLHVGDESFALAAASEEVNGRHRGFWWDDVPFSSSVGDVVQLRLTVPPDTCMEFTDPVQVWQANFDVTMRYHRGWAFVSGWESDSQDGDTRWNIKRARVRSGSPAFSWEGQNYELDYFFYTDPGMKRIRFGFTSDQPIPDKFHQAFAVNVENYWLEVGATGWRFADFPLTTAEVSDYRHEGKYGRRYILDMPKVLYQSIDLGIAVSLQNFGPPVVEDITVNQPPQGRDAFGAGDTIVVTLITDQPLTIPADARPVLGLRFDVPEEPRFATLNHAASDGKRLVFEYTVREGDADPDGYEIAVDALSGVTGIVSVDNEDVKPRLNCGSDLSEIDGARLPQVDADRVSGGGMTMTHCPGEVIEGQSFTCRLQNTSDRGQLVSWAVYVNPNETPPAHQWENLQVRNSGEQGRGGIIIKEPSGWSAPKSSYQDGAVAVRWTTGVLWPDQTVRATFTVQEDDVPEEPAVFRITWSYSEYAPGFKGIGRAVTVLDDDPPRKPTNLAATAGELRVNLAWDDPSDPTISGYEYSLEQGGVSDPWQEIPGSDATTVSQVVDGLDGGVEYTFQVRATNSVGFSEASDSATATPYKLPDKPTGLAATAGDTEVALDWDDPGDSEITGYQYFQVVNELEVRPSDAAAADLFGWSVAMDGDIMVVGAPFADPSGKNSGAAYVFQKGATGWADATQLAKLTVFNGAAGDWFGVSVAMDGDLIVVGASEGDREPRHNGAVYVFERPATGWADATETAKLTASDAKPGHFLGYSVDVHGDTIATGGLAPIHREGECGVVVRR